MRTQTLQSTLVNLDLLWLRAGEGAQQRLRDQLFEKLFVDTRLGKRLPIGLEKVIKEALDVAMDQAVKEFSSAEFQNAVKKGAASLAR